MNEQLQLAHVRGVLNRLEETIIYALIERAQFKQNLVIYKTGHFGGSLAHQSLVDYLLHETERIQAHMRRYTSPDEHPFFNDLPQPLLPPLAFHENPLQAPPINLNSRLKPLYETRMIPLLCPAGDDQQYGSATVCDVACLQALSKRVHYGKFVAESKYQKAPEQFQAPIRAQDEEVLRGLITDTVMENRVLERVVLKARAYGQDVEAGEGAYRINPDVVQALYRDWIIPLNKDVQIAYLLARQDGAAP